MEIIKVVPRGFCKGVVGAINIAKQTRLANPDTKITILGMLVHNKYVVKALHELNINTVEDKKLSRYELLDQIDSGIVIFTAHGIDTQTYEKALSKNLKIVDATCPDVIKTQNLIKAYIKHDYDVIYLGKKGHPESEASLAIDERVHLMETISDIENSNFTTDKLFLTNQTTMSIDDIAQKINLLIEKYPQIEVCEEICDATRVRQSAIANLKDIDLLYIVGDPHSNNSNRLAEIGLQHGVKRSLLIESVEDINLADLEKVERLAISSGASTPTYLTKQVIDYLENLDTNTAKPNVEISKIL